MTDVKTPTLGDATVAELLTELLKRGGTFAAVAEAQLLVLRKSEDYNGDPLTDRESARQRDVYFPFGAPSYAHMIHTKSQRLVQLVKNDLDGKAPNFEGARDSCLDLINYASFFVERMNRERTS